MSGPTSQEEHLQTTSTAKDVFSDASTNALVLQGELQGKSKQY